MNKIICELCGSNEFSKEGDMFMCSYCRTKYSPEQAKSMMVEGTVQVDRSNEVANLMALASSALESGNVAEAYEYANRVLEIDTSVSEAWFCKGSAAGWLSNLTVARVGEMVSSFEKACELTPDEGRSEIRERCARVMNDVGVGINNIALEHIEQFAMVDGTWEGYLSLSDQALVAFQQSYEWFEREDPLSNILTVTSNLIVGTSYEEYDPNWNIERTRWRRLDSDQMSAMRSLHDATVEEMKKFKPEFTSQRPEQGGGCFVVTATMGNDRSVPVRTLRDFRDTTLIRSENGKQLAGWYYANGPRFATVIARSRILRSLSLMFIVIPATVFAWGFMQTRKLVRSFFF